MKEQFLNPDRKFTPIPFWFWNDALSKPEIERQIDDFNSKGVNGFVIHPRMGMPKHIPYLSDEFMDYVKFAVEKAAQRDMLVVLYDEASYPSGSAHGLVVAENPNFASKGLRMSYEKKINPGECLVATVWVQKNGEAIEQVSEVPKEGWMPCYFVQQFSNGKIRGLHYGEDDGEPDAPPSGDLLSREAMNTFVRLTHQRYYDCLAPYFGTTIMGFFTDEPAIMGRNHDKGIIPWTDNFLEYFVNNGGKITDLPYLFAKSSARTVYERAVRNRLNEVFYGTLFDWCEKHGIAFTGHPEKSDDIGFLSKMHIPCQDIVWRYVEPGNESGITGAHSTMGKCVSDSARHRNKMRCGNEVLGCCGPKDDLWGLTYEDMLWYFGWLFVRGNNLLYLHAFFYSLRENRGNERPPDVGPNSPWWSEYHIVSDYIKRVCQLLSGSVNMAQIAVLCGDANLPWRPVKPLYQNQLEFNYLEKSLFSECAFNDEIAINSQRYKVLILDNTDALSDEEIGCINGFEGTKILYRCKTDKIFNARYAQTDEEILKIVKSAIQPDFDAGAYCPNLRYTHIRKENAEFYLLFNEGEETITFNLPGEGELWNPLSGEITKAEKTLSLKKGELNIFVKA